MLLTASNGISLGEAMGNPLSRLDSHGLSIQGVRDVLRDTYAFWLRVGQVIVLCSIQHVTHHVIGQVSGHVPGHVAQKGVGGHVRASQDHVVG